MGNYDNFITLMNNVKRQNGIKLFKLKFFFMSKALIADNRLYSSNWFVVNETMQELSQCKSGQDKCSQMELVMAHLFAIFCVGFFVKLVLILIV